MSSPDFTVITQWGKRRTGAALRHPFLFPGQAMLFVRPMAKWQCRAPCWKILKNVTLPAVHETSSLKVITHPQSQPWPCHGACCPWFSLDCSVFHLRARTNHSCLSCVLCAPFSAFIRVGAKILFKKYSVSEGDSGPVWPPSQGRSYQDGGDAEDDLSTSSTPHTLHTAACFPRVWRWPWGFSAPHWASLMLLFVFSTCGTILLNLLPDFYSPRPFVAPCCTVVTCLAQIPTLLRPCTSSLWVTAQRIFFLMLQPTFVTGNSKCCLLLHQANPCSFTIQECRHHFLRNCFCSK